MKGTCEPENCKFVRLLDGDYENCPNYVVGFWKADNEDEPIIVKDCAPKRLVMMMRNLEIRMLGVQQSNEQQRNKSTDIMDVFEKMLNQAARKNAYIAYEDTPLIEE